MLATVFSVFAFGLILCIPVGITLGMVSILPKLLDPAFAANVQFIVRQMVGGVDSTPILAIPLFVLSGVIMARGGVSAKIFNMFSFFLGDRTGGLPIAVVVSCLFYGAISGWMVDEIMRKKVEFYGLDSLYNYMDPGSDPALAAAMGIAARREGTEGVRSLQQYHKMIR